MGNYTQVDRHSNVVRKEDVETRVANRKETDQNLLDDWGVAGDEDADDSQWSEMLRKLSLCQYSSHHHCLA